MHKKIAVSYFKTHCLEILNKLQKSGEQIIITKRTKDLVKIMPAETLRDNLFDSFKNRAEIKEDIIKAIDEPWNACS